MMRANCSRTPGSATSFVPMSAEVTEDAALGGRLRLKQPRRGHRVGHDAILLAAACPARAGERVVDLGAGVGARVNAAVLDVAAPARAFAAAGLGPESVARVLMNPPFNDPARQRASPDRRRRLAHAGPVGALAVWIKTAARLLRPRGTLTMIWRADGLAEVLQALAPAFGAATVLPVHSGEGEAAVRVLVRATKASHAPLVLLPGFVLNDRAGRPTARAESVLRAGAALPLSEI